MCWGGGGDRPKAPTTTKAPDPSPRPQVTPSESSEAGRKESRRKRTRAYRSGFASTLKTGAEGVSGDKKQTLGS